jgi:preprotein translocase subunit SecE
VNPFGSVQNLPSKGTMERIRAFIAEAIQFFREVKVELQKVTFPTRQETVSSTLVVLVLTVIVAAYLGFSDWALARVVRILLHVG